MCICLYLFARGSFFAVPLFLLNHPLLSTLSLPIHSENMNVTAEQILGHINELDTAIRQGLAAGNINDMMKAQRPAMVHARPPFGR